MANCNNKCRHRSEDHSILYLMVFFILIGSCTDRTPLSRTSVRSIVSSTCAPRHEYDSELRTLKQNYIKLQRELMELKGEG